MSLLPRGLSPAEIRAINFLYYNLRLDPSELSMCMALSLASLVGYRLLLRGRIAVGSIPERDATFVLGA